MKVVFTGADPREAELAAMSIRLRWPDVTPLVAVTAERGLAMVGEVSPDVIILHPPLPDMSMSEVIRQLRCFSRVPLLVLSHQGDEVEVITALELGADDYVRLPCDLTEMMARIWSLLRRAGVGIPRKSEGPFLSGQLLINPATYEVFLDGQRLELTSTEFRLLHLMVRNRGRVLSRRNLEESLWGESLSSSGLLKKYIQRLRHKLGDSAQEPRWIARVYGIGYRFIGPVPEEPNSTGTAVATS